MKEFNPLLKDLVKEFSYETVFAPNKETVKLEKSDIELIYDLLNKHLFNSALKMPSIIISNAYSKTNHIAGYSFRNVLFKGDNTYTLVTKEVKTPKGKILFPPQILINQDITKQGLPLIFFVNVLAHEMIHQDDVENGTYLKRLYEDKTNKRTFDGHKGYFETMANTINDKFNLNIEKSSSSLENSIDGSMKAIRKALLEEEWKKIQNITESNNISDKEKLRRSIENIENTDDFHCEYLGNGAFDITIF